MTVFGRFMQNSSPVVKMFIAISITSVVEHNLFYVAGESENSPPKGADDFTAQVIVYNHPGQISNGTTPVLNYHTAHVTSKFDERKDIDRGSGKSTEGNPKIIKSGDSAVVSLGPPPPEVEDFQEFQPLGQTVAVDVIKSFKEAGGGKVTKAAEEATKGKK